MSIHAQHAWSGLADQLTNARNENDGRSRWSTVAVLRQLPAEPSTHLGTTPLRRRPPIACRAASLLATSPVEASQPHSCLLRVAAPPWARRRRRHRGKKRTTSC